MRLTPVRHARRRAESAPERPRGPGRRSRPRRPSTAILARAGAPAMAPWLLGPERATDRAERGTHADRDGYRGYLSVESDGRNGYRPYLAIPFSWSAALTHEGGSVAMR